MRTIESVGAFFQPLEEAIHQHFLPTLTGRMPSSEVERELLSLPCRFGGLNITNPTLLLLLLLSTLPVRHWRVYTEGRACSRCLPIA